MILLPPLFGCPWISIQNPAGPMLRTLAFLSILLCAAIARAEEPVFPPGSRIGLVPPPGMKLARGITGFQDSATGAAIVTIEMPAEAYAGVAAGFTNEALKAQGFALKTRDTVKVGAVEALVVSGDQTEYGKVAPKSILIAPDPTMTVLVIAQLPAGAPAAIEEQIRSAMRTVAIRAPLTMDEQLAVMPFRLVDLAGFRPIRAMAGNSVLLTDGPNDVIRNAEQPVLIVAQSYAPAPQAEQRDAFARSALGANTLLKDVVFERAQAFRQAGAEWHEIVAKARDGQSDQPVVVLQTIRFEHDGYLRMVGVVRSDQRDAVMPRFRAVVDAVALK